MKTMQKSLQFNACRVLWLLYLASNAYSITPCLWQNPPLAYKGNSICYKLWGKMCVGL